MLFVNISQTPLIVSLILLLLGIIASTLIRQTKLINYFFSSEQQQKLSYQRIRGIKTLKIICLILVSLMLGISLLDPRGSSLSSDIELEGMDVILVYDISRSMDVADIAPSRLSFAKNLGEQLINSLSGNRIGLVAYAADAIRLLPLTTDSSAVELFVQDLSTDMIGSQSTDINKALDEALKNFKEDTLTHKAIILFTDGENLDGNVKKSIDHIKQQGISLFVVGVGTEQGGPVPVYNHKTGQTNNIKTITGTEIISKLDNKYLQDLAHQTSGTYMLGSRATISKINQLIDNIEKSPFGTNTQSYLEPQFRVFILIALFALLLYLFIPEKKWYKRLSIFFILFTTINPTFSLTTERHAYSAYQNGDYSSALRFYQRRLIKNPKDLYSKFGEAATLYKLERKDRAENSFLALTNSKNKKISQQAIFNTANTRVQKQDFKGALELYKKILADTDPKSRLYKKSLNNYLYTKALENQKQQDQQNNKDNKEQQDNKDQQNNSDNKNQQENKDQQNNSDNKNQQENKDQQDNSDNKEKGNPEQKQNDTQNEQDQTPSQSINPNEIDNILGLAQEDEKKNFSKQLKKQKGLFQQDKY